jgi:hypothetical protein
MTTTFLDDQARLWADVYLPDEALEHPGQVIPEAYASYVPADTVSVTTWTEMFSSTSGPWGGFAGQAMTNFQVTVVRLPLVSLCFAGSVGYPGRPTQQDYLGCARTDDVPDTLHTTADYNVFVRPDKRSSLNPEATIKMLAEDIIRMAQTAGMPDSYFVTDTRVARACLVLGFTPEQVLTDGLEDLIQGR